MSRGRGRRTVLIGGRGLGRCGDSSGFSHGCSSLGISGVGDSNSGSGSGRNDGVSAFPNSGDRLSNTSCGFDVGSGSGSGGCNTSLVNLDVIDFPVRLRERRWVLSDISNAALEGAAAITHRAARGAVNTASPVTAEGGVEDELLGFEMFGDAARALHMGHGSAESSNIGVAFGDRAGNRTTGEEPELQEFIGPLHGVDTTTVLVERSARRTLGALNNTSSGTRIFTTFRRGKRAAHLLAGNLTGAARMQDNLVRFILIDALDDIYFTIRRPVFACGPKGGPGTADASGHVLKIDDKQSFVIILVAPNADRLPARTVGAQLRCMVDTHVEGTVRVDLDQPGAFGVALVSVRDESIRGVSACVKIESRQEVLALPGFHKLITAGCGGQDHR